MNINPLDMAPKYLLQQLARLSSEESVLDSRATLTVYLHAGQSFKGIAKQVTSQGGDEYVWLGSATDTSTFVFSIGAVTALHIENINYLTDYLGRPWFIRSNWLDLSKLQAIREINDLSSSQKLECQIQFESFPDAPQLISNIVAWYARLLEEIKAIQLSEPQAIQKITGVQISYSASGLAIACVENKLIITTNLNAESFKRSTVTNFLNNCL